MPRDHGNTLGTPSQMTLTRFSCWPEFDHHWFPSPLADGSLLSDAMRNGKKWGGICLICEFKEAFFQCTYLYIKLHFFGNALSNYVTIYCIYFKYNMIFNAMTFTPFYFMQITGSRPHLDLMTCMCRLWLRYWFGLIWSC